MKSVSKSDYRSVYDDAAVVSAFTSGKAEDLGDYKNILSRMAEEADGVMKSFCKLMSDACDLGMSCEDGRVKFSPRIQLANGRRSAALEDFTAEDAEGFASMVDMISDLKLKARIADVAYQRAAKGSGIKFKMAVTAIESYLKLPIHTNAWRHEGHLYWQRALELARGLGLSGHKFVEEISLRMKEAFFLSKDLHADYDLAGFIIENKLYGEDGYRIAEKFEKDLEACHPDSDELYREHGSDYLITLYRQLGDEKHCIHALYKKGIYQKEAGDSYRNMNADPALYAHRYEAASLTFSEIPKRYRAEYDIDALVRDCTKIKREGQKIFAKGMRHVAVPIEGVKETAKKVEEYMHGLDAQTALLHFSLIYRFDIDAFNACMKSFDDKCVIMSLFNMDRVDEEGRVEARGKGGNREFIECQAYQVMLNYAIPCIISALRVWKAEHSLTHQDFRAIVGQSRIVPHNRKESVANGLWYGYNGDYHSSVVVLLPQLENLLRKILKRKNVEVRTTEKNGVETYHGLSTMLVNNADVLSGCFGAEVWLEMKLLFGRAPYLNFRNVLEHGLLNDPGGGKYYSIELYIWWWFLRYVVLKALVMEKK